MKFPIMYDRITQVLQLDALARGPLHSEKPLGITVHYTADRDLQSTFDALKTAGSDYSLGYHVVIDRNGCVTQLARFDRMVYHAGKALWLGESPNRTHIAVALLSYGELKKDIHGNFTSWSGVPIDPHQADRRKNNVNEDYSWWDVATPAQETSLKMFLLWCVAHGINPESICGHDECAIPKGRKVDPGGVLSTTMQGLRDWLAEQKAKTQVS